ncbi:MAG: hypothetical protein LQ347_002851 [Umbilicaria vellea]|nr:MAG: hypothetical protein LQ347_002851 [Umbilicaria vellea]
MDSNNVQGRPDGEDGSIEVDTNVPNPNSSTVKIWSPARFLSTKLRDAQSGKPYAVIILNQPIDNKELLVDVCPIYKACADGGANRLQALNLKRETEMICPSKKPDIICGDLDSLLPAVKAHYQALGTRIIQDPDQYSTDFAKCLKHIRGLALHPPASNPAIHHPLDVAVIGGLGGRADQAFSQIHHLYAASQDPALASGDVYLLTGESVVFLLRRGKNLIRTPLGPGLLAENVGIIPIAGPAVITTRGLEWDVEDWPTEFGVQVSTSNHVKAGVVEVETTERVLFTVEVARMPVG